LVEQGFDVQLARTVEEAKSALRQRTFALVLSEVDIDERDAGFHFRADMKASLQDTGWIFLSGRSSRVTAQRAFDMDIDDFISKPVQADVVVAKVSQIIQKHSQKVAPRGVSGSLSEMGLPELIQVLWHGRKTCSLQITSDDATGEIHLQDGKIVHAFWGDEIGENAFYRMVALRENGNFQVDHGGAARERQLPGRPGVQPNRPHHQRVTGRSAARRHAPARRRPGLTPTPSRARFTTEARRDLGKRMECTEFSVPSSNLPPQSLRASVVT
jgi:ActR/RegA family two-component response regulator